MTSYQANFAGQHTRDHHVDFLLQDLILVLEIYYTTGLVNCYLVYTTISNDN